MKNAAFSASSRRLFFLCFFAYSIIYIGRKNFSVCMPGMVELGVIDKVLGGTIGTAFLAVYAGGQLVNGLLGDRMNPRYMMSAGLAGAAAANIAMGLNSMPVLFPVIWGINGFFCSMMWAPMIRILSEALSAGERQSAGAAISATIPTGTVLSYLICAAALKAANWRAAFICCGIILTVSMIFFHLNMTVLSGKAAKNQKIRNDNPGSADRQKTEPDLPQYLIKLKNAGLPAFIISTGLYFCIAAVLFNGILKDGLDLWVPIYISEYFHISDSIVAVLSIIMPIINITGIYISRRLNLRYIHNDLGTCAVLFAVSIVFFIPIILISLSGIQGILPSVASMLLFSITSAAALGINSMLLTFIPFRFVQIGRSSTVTGFLNACSYGAASFSGIIIGLISSNLDWTATVISFSAAAAAGAVVCAAGTRTWAKTTSKLNDEPS